MPFFRTLSSLNSAIPDAPVTTRRFDSTFDDVYFFLRPDSTVTDPKRNNLISTNGTLGLTGIVTDQINTNQTTFSPFLRPEGYWSAEVGTGVSYIANFNQPINLEDDFTISFWYMARPELQKNLVNFSRVPNRAIDVFNLGNGAIKFTQNSITAPDSITVRFAISFDSERSTYNTLSSFLINKWYYITICRSGTGNGNLVLYVDGNIVITMSNNTRFSNIKSVSFNDRLAQNIYGAQVFSGGYGIGDFRVVLNRSFIPKQKPALSPALESTTAIQLFHSYNTLKVGTNNAQVTVLRTPSSINVDNQSFFSKSFSFCATAKTGYQYRVPYNPAINGGSLRLVNDTLATNGVQFQLPTFTVPVNIPFTAEFWAYSNATNSTTLHLGNQIVITLRDFDVVVKTRIVTGAEFFWRLIDYTPSVVSTTSFIDSTISSIDSTGTYGSDRYNWSHYAIVKGSTQEYNVYKNGKKIGFFILDHDLFSDYNFDTIITKNNFIKLGASSRAAGANTFFITGLRIIRNQALTTGNFTPPNGPINTTQIGWSGANVALSLTGEVLITSNFTNGHVGDASGRASIQALTLIGGTALRSNLEIIKTAQFSSGNNLTLENVTDVRIGQQVSGNLFPVATLIEKVYQQTRVIQTKLAPTGGLLPSNITLKNFTGTNLDVLEINDSLLKYQVDLNNTSNFDGNFDWHIEIRFLLTHYNNYGLFERTINTSTPTGFIVGINGDELFMACQRGQRRITGGGYLGASGGARNVFFLTKSFIKKPLLLNQWYNLNVIQEKQKTYAYLNGLLSQTLLLDIESIISIDINQFTINSLPSWATNFFSAPLNSNYGIIYDYYRLSYNKFTNTASAPKLGSYSSNSGIRPLVAQIPPLSPNG